MDLNAHSKRFGRLAGSYSKFRRPYKPSLYDVLWNRLGKVPKDILDVACGNGVSTRPLLRFGNRVTGCDHDHRMIREAKRRVRLNGANVKFTIAEADHLPFDDMSFDAVTVGSAFHWFATVKTALELKRVLRNNGIIFIYWIMWSEDERHSYPIPASVFRKYSWHRVPSKLRDRGYVMSLLRSAGFIRIESHTVQYEGAESFEEHIGQLSTASAYSFLSPIQRRAFRKEVLDCLELQSNRTRKVKLHETIHVVIGKRPKNLGYLLDRKMAD